MGRVNPGEGERRAASGYGGQYRIAAQFIYSGIRNDQLSWVGVADPEAGRVDDLLLGVDGRVDAFQVKWSQFAGSFSFNDLVAPIKARSGEVATKPCLIAQLAEGWGRLRARFPGQRVVVHLVTNDLPSKHDAPPTGAPSPSPKHFAAFLAQAWHPAHSSSDDGSVSIPQGWRPAWESLVAASGLLAGEFDLFANDLELDFGFAVTMPEIDSQLDASAYEDDRTAIEKFLFDFAGDPEHISTLTREELIARLGWGDRYRPRSRHEFPAPAFTYEPIRPTKDELELKLDTTRGGYLAVLGPPGSGKSTLLTESLRTRTERKIRYYAYVPDSIEPGRGEARNFLHDVVIAIERAGFRAGESIPGVDRTDLSRRLHLQLANLHQDFIRNGRRTIILVDGLDHIDREQHPERSLLRDLPPPEHIPDGVLFLLGSQTAQLPDLPSGIEFQLRDSGRRMEMQPLTRDATLRLLDRAGLTFELDSNQRIRFLELTEGHPLSIDYLLNRLRQAPDTTHADEILSDEVSHGGDIRTQYHAFWQRHVKDSPGLRRLLGLMACHRGAIDLDWLEVSVDAEAVRILRERAAHYFRVEGSRWHFYHNSFRQFLLERITEVGPGVHQEERVRKLHADLAARSVESSKVERRWEELYHLMMAEEDTLALQRATQELFRGQFIDFRPPTLIRADIEQALRIATRQRDLVALGRLLFAFVECGDRESYLEEVPVASILVELGEEDQATVLSRAGHRLLVGAREGLRLARKFARKGLLEEAKQLFSLAEPLDQLFSTDVLEIEERRGERDILSEWARTATLFRPAEEVLKTISPLRFRHRFDQDVDVEAFTISRRATLVFHVGIGLLRQKRWDDVSRCLDSLCGPNEDEQEARLWLQLRLVESLDAAGESSRAGEALVELCSGINPVGAEVSSSLKLAVAEASLSLGMNQEWTRDVAQNLEIPEVSRLSINSDLDWGYFSRAFHIASLRFFFGEQKSIEEIVPHPEDSKLRPTAIVLRDIIRIARMSARASRGEEVISREFEAETRAILRRFSFNKNRTRERHDWFPLFSLRDEIYSLLVRVVRRLGADHLDQLRMMFEAEWADPVFAAHWHPNLRRTVLLALWRAGAPREWVISGLEAVETVMLDGQDVGERVRACKEHIDSYIEVRALDRARRLLNQAVSTAIGVGYRKDYQLDTWLEWLDLAFDIDPAKREDRIQWHAKAAVSLRDTSERGHGSASLKLVEIVARRDLAAAFRLVLWFQEQGVISHEDAAAVLLRETLKVDPSQTDFVLAFTAFVLVAYSFAADRQLILELLESLRVKGRPSVIAGARLLVENAERFASHSPRSGWFNALRDALAAAGVERWVVSIPNIEAHGRQASSPEDALQRRDGTKLSADEVLSRISTVDDLLGLLAEQLDNKHERNSFSMFDWRKAVRKVLPRLDRRKIPELGDALTGRWRDSFCLAVLARHARSIGETELARDLAGRAVRLSNHSGWDRHYDGGSRLDALECLIEIDPVRGREEAWKRFREDFHEENFSRVRFAFNLDRIAKLLSDQIPVGGLYAEVEKHVHSLFDGVDFVEAGPDLRLDEVESKVGAEETLAQLIEFHLVHPAPWMLEAAWRCLGHILRTRQPAAAKLVERLFDLPERVVERLIPVLESISREDPAFVVPHRERILALARSPHGGIRCTARRIAARLRWTLPARTLPLVSSPPSIYSLVLPPAGLEATEEIVAMLDGHGPHSPDSAEALLLAQRPEIDEIARVTDVPASNLIIRASQIMAEHDPNRGWTDEAETKLRNWLEEMGPKFTYRRPRFLAGQRAVHHLLAELEDHRIVRPADIPRLCSLLRWYDPSLVLRVPSVRPSAISPLAEERISYGDRWLSEIEEAFARLLVRTEEGTVVLAEASSLTRPVWEKNREERLSHFVTGFATTVEDGERFFARIMVGLVEYYRSYGHRDVHPPLVLRNAPFHLEGAGVEWLGLNPWVGEELGWNLASDGFFRWVAPNGQMMAETIHWVDGPNDLSPFRDDEVGEGCLVLLHPDGAKEIVNRFGPIKRITRVTRSYLDDGSTRQESRSRIQSWQEVWPGPE